MSLDANQLAMSVLMTPDRAFFSGNVHGGTILKPLDQVACACASRYAARYVVTLSVDQVTFKQSIHASGSIAFLSSVNFRVKKHPWKWASRCWQKISSPAKSGM